MAVHAARVRRRTLLVAAAALALAIAIIGPESPATSVPQLPQGWRWESFGGVQVGIPGGWGWGNGDQRIGQWCVDPQGAKPPIVGRPKGSTLVGCGAPGAESLIQNTGQIVAFQRTTPSAVGQIAGDSTSAEGDSLLIRRSGVDVTIIAEPALRRQIAGTVHLVDVDANGCPTRDPVSTNPTSRPTVVQSVQSLGEVQAVSVCQYPLLPGPTRRPPETPAPKSEPEPTTYVAPGPRLIASALLSGDEARTAVRGIDTTPTGSGPNRPWNCIEQAQYGDEVIVLRISRARGDSQVYLRYHGCNHHGFDDGTTVHRLTVPSAAAFLVGGVQVDGVDRSLVDLIRLG
jgi:hypothetical protein